MAVNRVALSMLYVAQGIDRLTDYIKNAAQGSLAYRHRNWTTGINSHHATDHSVGWLHRHGAHTALTQVLFHFRDDIDGSWHVKALGNNPQRLIDWWKILSVKFDIDNGSDYLHDFTERLTVAGRV